MVEKFSPRYPLDSISINASRETTKYYKIFLDRRAMKTRGSKKKTTRSNIFFLRGQFEINASPINGGRVNRWLGDFSSSAVN